MCRSVKIQGSSQRTADWVDSLNNEPIIIDDDEDEEEDTTQTTKSDSSVPTPTPATKRGNIFTILEEKKEQMPNADELPDLEEKLPGLGLFEVLFLSPPISLSVSNSSSLCSPRVAKYTPLQDGYLSYYTLISHLTHSHLCWFPSPLYQLKGPLSCKLLGNPCFCQLCVKYGPWKE